MPSCATIPPVRGPRQSQWTFEWERTRFPRPEAEQVLWEWLHPLRPEDLAGKRILDAGCGRGEYSRIFARHARHVVSADLNTTAVARSVALDCPNVRFVCGDIARLGLRPVFDVVICVGVLHHTPSPEATFRSLTSLVRPGGRLALWVYGHEGNGLNRLGVEPLKRAFLRRVPRPALWEFSHWLTVLLHLPVQTVYRLPLRFLPYAEYLARFRRLPFAINQGNVFDKLNAPVTHFLSREVLAHWFESVDFEAVHLSPYLGISWRASGSRRPR